MKKMIPILVLLCLWHLVGVFGLTAVQPVRVMEGDSATLNTHPSVMKGKTEIHWWFGKHLLAEMNVINDSIVVHDEASNGTFRNRLKVDNQTRSLTITNFTFEDVGNYVVQTKPPMRITFILTVYNKVKSVSVTEGESVILNSGLTDISRYNITWKSETEELAMAHKYNTDGRFRDRLKLDNQTGSLTITNITTEQAGLYKLRIIFLDVKATSKELNVSVYARLSVPVLIKNSSSSQYNCSVLCSVVNVSAVSLSWYKGNSVLSSISVSDLSISLSLPLEVEYQNKNTYSCVINNTISNQTTHLDINMLCQTSEDTAYCCGPIKAVIRLVLSALVGVATVIIVIYDVKSRRAEGTQAHIHASET